MTNALWNQWLDALAAGDTKLMMRIEQDATCNIASGKVFILGLTA